MIQEEEPYRELDGIIFDGSVYYKISGFHLGGSDTLRFSVLITENCNVIGCYTDSNDDTNFSLYSTTSTTARYLRHGSYVRRGGMQLNKRYDAVITPTGFTGLRYSDTWPEEEFTSPADMCIGTTTETGTSAFLHGTIYGRIIVDDRETFIPVERRSDGAIGYLGMNSKTFFQNLGSGTPAEYIEA